MHAEPKSFQVFLGIFYCHVGLAKGTGVDFVGFSDRWFFTKDLRRRQLSQVGVGSGEVEGKCSTWVTSTSVSSAPVRKIVYV